MDKKQLLVITKNQNFLTRLECEANFNYEITSVKSVHVGYSLALSHLPDVILIDYPSLGFESLKNLNNFRVSHFLNKSFLFLIGDKENRRVLETSFKDLVDGIIYDPTCCRSVINNIEDTIDSRRCLTNYWKDSFMGLFNLLNNPVILLQNEKIVAMNDSFKRDFFITGRQEIKLSDLVLTRTKSKVKETLRRFIKGKHLKASTTTVIRMKDKLREAKITLSKLDKSLSGQVIMMINFTGKESPLREEIGSCSLETENYFTGSATLEEQSFTKREKEIISLLCKGYKTKEISDMLCISSKTIEKHRANIVRRTNSGTILESIVYALNHRMIDI